MVTQNPLIGRSKQSLGGTTATTWKGKNVLKSKPMSVANPRTDAQVSQRSALSLVLAIYRQISGAIKTGFREQANGMSEYNAFMSEALKNAVNFSTPLLPELNAADLKVSKGTIAPTPIGSAAIVAGTGALTITWDTSSLQPGQSANDKAVLVAMDTDAGIADYVVTNISRSVGTATATLERLANSPNGASAAYLFFYNPSTRKESDSVAYEF